jgi:hypothetical protein
MSLARKLAFISGCAWLVITVALLVLFFTVGPEAFTTEENSGARLVSGSIILPGYLLNFGIILWARRGRKRGDLDERDKAVERLASGAVAIIMVLLFFGTTLGLYEHYRELGSVPVGWMYLLAYGAVAVVSLAHPLVTLIVDYSGAADG